MSEVFISYARSTEAAARQIEAHLRALGYEVWRDDELPAHRAYTDVIEERLRSSKAVVVRWSAEAAKSEWVQSEADHARAGHKLVQLTLDGASLPMPFDRIQCADLTGWTGDMDAPGWAKVVSSVAELVGRPPRRRRSVARGLATSATPTAAATVPRRRSVPSSTWVVAGLALVAVVAGGAWWLFGRAPTPQDTSTRVAVLPFDTSGAQGADALAAGLQDEILGVLSNNHVETVSRTESAALRGSNAGAVIARLGVGLLLDGSVESDGPLLHVRAHLDDAVRRVTLWSKDFEGTASDPSALQATVAARVSDITGFAQQARAAPSPLDTPAMIALLRATDSMTNPTDPEAGITAEGLAAAQDLREVTGRAPSWGVGHARLALALSGNPAATAEARSEAQRALALDSHASEAYLALAVIEVPSRWAVRERLLDSAIAADPQFSFAALFKARLLTQVGRLSDALPLAQQAVAQRPLFPGGQSTLGDLLVQNGRVAAGREVLDHAAALWPEGLRIKLERLGVVLGLHDMAAASALLENPQTRPPYVAATQLAPWRAAIAAGRSHDPGEVRAAAAEVRRAADSGAMAAQDAFGLCAMLGDLDCAFAEADRFYAGSAETTPLFTGPGGAMRRDPRFMALAAKLGLVDYWRSTGHWPDFCAEPGLPYDCKSEAAKVAAKRPA
jgi:TolB-like protein